MTRLKIVLFGTALGITSLAFAAPTRHIQPAVNVCPECGPTTPLCVPDEPCPEH
jgi:hypothetical protein